MTEDALAKLDSLAQGDVLMDNDNIIDKLKAQYIYSAITSAQARWQRTAEWTRVDALRLGLVTDTALLWATVTLVAAVIVTLEQLHSLMCPFVGKHYFLPTAIISVVWATFSTCGWASAAFVSTVVFTVMQLLESLWQNHGQVN